MFTHFVQIEFFAMNNPGRCVNQWPCLSGIKKHKILITCAKGIPPYLQAEIEAAGRPVRVVLDAAVETEGTLIDAMALNLAIRTGQRVLYLIQSFRAKTPTISTVICRECPGRNGLTNAAILP